jgi:hypothetical protein
MGSSTLSTQVDANGRPKPTPVTQVNTNSHTQAHSGGTSRLQRAHLMSAMATQVDFCSRNLKATLTVAILIPLRWQYYSFSLIFHLILPSRTAFHFLHLKSTHLTQS